MQMAINNWMHEDTILHITPLMHVQHYLMFTVCYSEEPATKKTKYSASEQRRATLRNTLLDNERLVLEKQKLVLEIEVLQETKEV